MVSTVILSLTVLGFVQVYRGTSMQTTLSRNKTNAAFFAKEQLGALAVKSQAYLPLNDAPTLIPGPAESLFADVAHYPPETRSYGGVDFTRYTLVEKVGRGAGEDLEVRLISDKETNMRRITCTVVWQENGAFKHYSVNQINETGSSVRAAYPIQGVVRSTAGAPLMGAFIYVIRAGDASWSSGFSPTMADQYTDTSGSFGFNVGEGTISIRVSLAGYEPKLVGPLALNENTAPLTISPISLNFRPTGRIQGSAWKNNTLVISQVVGSKMNGLVSQEWVQIFNPTTWTWTMADVGLRFQRQDCDPSPCAAGQDPEPIPIDVNYVTPTLPSDRYFVFANVNPIVVGTNVTPDATWNLTIGDGVCDPAPLNNNDDCFPYFSPATPNVIPVETDLPGVEGAGGLELYYKPTGQVLDRVGWAKAAGVNGGIYESTPVADGTGMGLQTDELYQRVMSTAGYNINWSPAYDSGINNLDFVRISPAIQTKNFASGYPPGSAISPYVWRYAGKPCIGCYVTATDLTSPITTTTMAMSGGRPYALFDIPMVSTGYGIGVWWSDGEQSGGQTSGSGDRWVMAGQTRQFGNTFGNGAPFGIISGTVRDRAGVAIPHIIVNDKYADASGNYRAFIRTQPLGPSYGNVFANWGGTMTESYDLNRNFQSFMTTWNFTPNAEATGQDITLNGYATVRGAFLSQDGSGSAISGNQLAICVAGTTTSVTSTFWIGSNFAVSVPSGTYSVNVTFYDGYRVEPPPTNFVIGQADLGTDIFIGTFTIVPNFATLRGRVMKEGLPIGIGVPLNLRTSTLAPGVIASLSGMGAAGYMGTADQDGRFEFQVVPGTYHLYAWDSDFVNGVSTTTRAGAENLVLSTGAVVVQDLTW